MMGPVGRAAAASASWLALFAACGDGGDRTVWLPFPPGAEAAKALVLAVEREGALRVFAYALDPAPGKIEPPLVLPTDGDAQVVAMLHAKTLAELSLTAGE